MKKLLLTLLITISFINLYGQKNIYENLFYYNKGARVVDKRLRSV